MPTKKHGADDADQKPRPRLEPGTFAVVSDHVTDGPRLKHSEWCVYIGICAHADTEGYAWPSQELIAQERGLHRSTVTRAIKRLAEVGHIIIVERKRRGGRWASNSYRVIRLARKVPPKPCAHKMSRGPCAHKMSRHRVLTR